MIPAMNIVAWSKNAPWAEQWQIEQDLIISRALVELFNDPFLVEQLRPQITDRFSFSPSLRFGHSGLRNGCEVRKRHLAEHELRLALIDEICIDKGALVYHIDTDQVFFSADEAARKNAYVTVFQAWAKGTIKGTAE